MAGLIKTKRNHPVVLSYTRVEFVLGFSKHFKCQQSLGTYIFSKNPLIGAGSTEQRVPIDTLEH